MNCSNKPKVLLVDDRPQNLLTLGSLLEDLEVELIKAGSGNEALGLLLEHDFALVLLDVQMPEMDGFEVAELMRGSDRTRHVPIIFVTALSTEREYVFKGYEMGAVDYLFKPLNPHILKSKVQIFLEMFGLRQQLEERNRALDSAAEQLRKAALTDPLTELRNRRFLQEVIENDIALVRRSYHGLEVDDASRPANADLGFLLIDVDHFKQVNDRHGHDAGDAVLKTLARVLTYSVRESDAVVRWGGEEFLILLRQTDGPCIGAVAERVRKAVAAEPSALPGGEKLTVTCSVGFAAHPQPGGDGFGWKDAISLADAALMLAKARGRNRSIGVELVRIDGSRDALHAVLSDLEAALDDGRARLLDP